MTTERHTDTGNPYETEISSLKIKTWNWKIQKKLCEFILEFLI